MATEDDRYAAWLSAHGVGTETVDLSQRTQVNVRLYLDDVRKCPVGWTVARSVDEAITVMREFTVHLFQSRQSRGCHDLQVGEGAAMRVTANVRPHVASSS